MAAKLLGEREVKERDTKKSLAQKQNPQTCLSTPLLRHLIHTLFAYQTASKHFNNVN
jgi:hypothetical protein